MFEEIEATVAPQSAVSPSLVPRMIGRILAFVYYGIAFAISIRYFLSEDSHRDPKRTRICILFVMSMTTAATIVFAIDTISIAVAQERTFEYFNEVNLVTVLYKFGYSAIILCTQAFLARRAYLLAVHADLLLSRKSAWTSPSVLVLLTIVPLTMVISLTGYIADFIIAASQYHDLAYPTDLLEIYGFTVAVFASAVTDMAISTVLGWHCVTWLRREKLSRGVNSFLRTLIALTIGTALFTTVPAVVAAALSIVSTSPSGVTTESIYHIFSDPLPQLYAISLFTTLAVRRSKDNQPAERTLAPLPMSQQAESGGSPERTWVGRRGSSEFKGVAEDRLEVHLESGGFQIASAEYYRRDAAAA